MHSEVSTRVAHLLHGFSPSHCQRVSQKHRLALRLDKGAKPAHKYQDQPLRGRLLTFARAFLQLRQAFRVTDSGTLRRLEEEVLLSGASFSLRARRGSDPALSGVDCGLLADVLSSLNEGRILREDINNQWAVSFKVCLV